MMMDSPLLARIRENGLTICCRLGGGCEARCGSRDPSGLWTGEALGWQCLRGCTFFASPPFLLGSFPPVLLELSCSLVDEVAPIVSVKCIVDCFASIP